MGWIDDTDKRSRIERGWDDQSVVVWVLIIVAALGAIWAYRHPIPGLSIGLLALMAGIISLRPRMKFSEKIAWVLLLSVFAGFEVAALSDSDKAATKEKKDLTQKLVDIRNGLDETLRRVNVIKDGMDIMLSNKQASTGSSPSKPPSSSKPIPEPDVKEKPTGRRFVDAEKLGLYLLGKDSASSASVINDGTNEAGNLANQLVIGLIGGKWIAGGNNVLMGDPTFFPDPLTIEVSKVKASDDDRSIESAKILQSALEDQHISATLRYTSQVFPPNFMRVKISGQ